METTLFLWSSSNSSSSSSSHREIAIRDDSASLNPNPNPKTRPERRGRAAKPNPPKPKNPQRGLGVAQLERIRLQERWIQPTPPAYESYGTLASLGAPVAYAGSTAAAALIGYGSRSASVLRSPLYDQYYSPDRFRTGANPFLHELPSNQRGTPPCLTEHCEFCYRKKKLFGENLGFHGTVNSYFSAMDSEKRRKFERETKEYEFFPNNSNPTYRDSAAGVSPSATADDGNFLDLSLKL